MKLRHFLKTDKTKAPRVFIYLFIIYLLFLMVIVVEKSFYSAHNGFDKKERYEGIEKYPTAANVLWEKQLYFNSNWKKL